MSTQEGMALCEYSATPLFLYSGTVSIWSVELLDGLSIRFPTQKAMHNPIGAQRDANMLPYPFL